MHFIEGQIRNREVVNVYVDLLIKGLGMNKLRKPYVYIKFVNNLEALGFCEGDRDYAEITIAKKCPITGRKLGFIEMMQTLAHEMVHARQFIRGQLDSAGGWVWKGRKAEGFEYENQPWEKEAYRLEKTLFMDCFPHNLEFKN